MSVLKAYAQEVKRTLDNAKTLFLDPLSTTLLADPEAAKRNKWTLLEKKFQLLQIEIEKQALVEELDILSKEHPRKLSPKKFDLSPPISGWGPHPSPKKNTQSLPPPPKENEEPKKS